MHLGSDIEHPIVVKIQSRDGIMRAWLRGFFLEAYCPTPGVKLHHAVAFGILYPIAEDSSTLRLACHLLQGLRQPLAVKDVIAQNQCHSIVPHKRAPDEKRLCQSCRLGLLRVGQLDTPLASIAQQLAKQGQMCWS